jgi:single-strand DNA-binding protein
MMTPCEPDEVVIETTAATKIGAAQMPAETNEQETTERRREPKGSTLKVGNLTKDPEIRFGANGTAYTNFSLAEERPKKAGNWVGERETSFNDCVCFRTLAENVAASLSKGDRAIVQGHAELEHWTDRDGRERTSKRSVASHVGAELRFATVVIQKVSGSGPKPTGPDEGHPDSDEPFLRTKAVPSIPLLREDGRVPVLLKPTPLIR